MSLSSHKILQAACAALALGAFVAAAALQDPAPEERADEQAPAALSPEVREAAALSNDEIARRLESSVKAWAPTGTLSLEACELVRRSNRSAELCADPQRERFSESIIDAGWLAPGDEGARIVPRGIADQVIVPYRADVARRARAVEESWSPEAAAIIADTREKADLAERLPRLQRRWREMFPDGARGIPLRRVAYCSSIETTSVDLSTDDFTLLVAPGDGDAALALLAELSRRCAAD